MDDRLLEIAGAGLPIVTVNKRLARVLRDRYDTAMREAGKTAWPTPQILPLEAWLREQLQRIGRDPDLLDDSHALFLWEQIIEAELDPEERPVFQVPATARKARAAHLLLKQFAADLRSDECAEDHRRFLHWRAEWLQRLRENGWIERGDAPWLVAEAFGDGRLAVPKALVLAGFDDLTPDIKFLKQTLTEQGCAVSFWLALIRSEARQIRVACVDRADEVRSCARWVRRLRLDGRRRIGVVAPDLENYRPLVEPIFRAELDPEGLAGGEDHPGVFSISLGNPLAAEGVVRAALRLLDLPYRVPLADLSWLLRSPYLGGAQEEGPARARAERLLRECGEVVWPLPQLLHRCRAFAGVDQMTRVLSALQADLKNDRPRTAGAWAEHFAALLDKIGWPGQRGLDSREYQAVRHFLDLLGRLASLDRVSGPVRRHTALRQLSRLAAETIFQPETPQSEVQILGLLEAAGMDFDHLWVLGLHESALPGPPQPNPFLPLPLQRRHGMPHADAEREKLFADRVAQRLFGSAPEVVLSYPRRIEGTEHRPSPYLAGVRDESPELAETADPAIHMNARRPALDALQDHRARGLAPRAPFTGGTTLVQDQALCPFRAFGHHRLRAERLQVPDVGLDAMARGTLVHAVLELFWKKVGDLDGLQALADKEVEEILEAAAASALQQLEKKRRRDLPPRLRGLEQARLVRLGREWLQIEAQRPAFTVVEVEKLHQESVGRLVIRTRIDRIDRLPDGRLVILDYKTGRPDPARWVGERVTEPQLPIYCLGLGEEVVAGVAYAGVRAGDCRFRGLVRDEVELPGLSSRTQERLLTAMAMESLDDVLRHWKEAVPRLGDAFVDGVAVVDPVDTQQACRYCDLVPLCRILERTGLAGEGADD